MMRPTLLPIAFLLGFACFLAGLIAAYYRLPPYRLLTRAISGTPLAQPHTPPAYRLWRESYQQQTGSAAIVMLGDSITRLGNWPSILKRRDIFNLGIPGDTTYGILKRLDDGNMPAGSTVFILAGVNDVITSIPTEETLANLEQIVARLSKRHRVYLQSTILTDRPGWNADIARVVAGERALCDRLPCTFLDLNAVLAPQGTLPPAYHADGIHLSAAGYRQWAGVIGSYLPASAAPQASAETR